MTHWDIVTKNNILLCRKRFYLYKKCLNKSVSFIRPKNVQIKLSIENWNTLNISNV